MEMPAELEKKIFLLLARRLDIPTAQVGEGGVAETRLFVDFPGSGVGNLKVPILSGEARRWVWTDSN
jgi:hypothetical protein